MIEAGAAAAQLPSPIIPASDALALKQAADEAAVSRDTLLRHATRYGFAQQRGRKWVISRLGLRAWMGNDAVALAAYRRGELQHPSLQRYAEAA